MVRRPFKTENNQMKNSKSEKTTDEIIVTNVIKEIPLNEPPVGKMNLSDAKFENNSEFSEQVSNKMGEMMLQGYMMLNECCPNCGNVLLANRRKEKGCVACAMRIIRDMDLLDEGKNESKNDREGNFITMETKKENIVRNESQEQKMIPNAPKKSLSDRISARMGDLLIKGHRMLDEYCPVCYGILMEDPQTSAKDCIACQLSNTNLEKPPQKKIKNELSTIIHQETSCDILVKNKLELDFQNTQLFAIKAVSARLQHTSSIVGDITLPLSSQDVLINLEIIKECLNILKEYGALI